MEEILILVLQFLVELFIQCAWDFFWYREPKDPNHVPAVFIGFVSLVAGGILSAVSLLILPDVLTQWAWLRCVQLVFVPLFVGTTAYAVANARSTRKSFVTPSHHFWWSFLFSFSFIVVRFAYAHRP